MRDWAFCPSSGPDVNVVSRSSCSTRASMRSPAVGRVGGRPVVVDEAAPRRWLRLDAARDRVRHGGRGPGAGLLRRRVGPGRRHRRGRERGRRRQRCGAPRDAHRRASCQRRSAVAGSRRPPRLDRGRRSASHDPAGRRRDVADHDPTPATTGPTTTDPADRRGRDDPGVRRRDPRRRRRRGERPAGLDAAGGRRHLPDAAPTTDPSGDAAEAATGPADPAPGAGDPIAARPPWPPWPPLPECPVFRSHQHSSFGRLPEPARADSDRQPGGLHRRTTDGADLHGRSRMVVILQRLDLLRGPTGRRRGPDRRLCRSDLLERKPTAVAGIGNGARPECGRGAGQLCRVRVHLQHPRRRTDRVRDRNTHRVRDAQSVHHVQRRCLCGQLQPEPLVAAVLLGE